MIISIELGKKHSKQNTEAIAGYVLAHPSSMKELMKYFFDKDIMTCQYASCVVELVAKHKPKLITSYLDKMIKCLADPQYLTLVRNVLRVFQHLNIPSTYEGEVFERCYQFIATPQVPVAIRAFSMTVCFNIAKEIPELRHELALTIEAYMENSKPAYKSRGKKIIMLLKKDKLKNNL